MENQSYLERLAEYGINSAHPGGLVLTRRLLLNEKLTPNTVLLDVGCGTGLTSAYIGSHYPCTVVAVDINPKMLEKAKQNFVKYHLDIPLIRANAMELPFRKNCFDIILAESVTAFTDISRALTEYARVLKLGGILLEIEVTAFIPLTDNELRNLRAVLGITSLPTRDKWCELFRDAGFSDVQVLSLQKMPVSVSFSMTINRVFYDYISIMRRLRPKLRYGVYRCRL